MNDEHKIPGAHIPDDVVSRIKVGKPDLAGEITRLIGLLGCGEETAADIRALGQLLFDAGEIQDSEYLLRRNLEEGDTTYQLYRHLFSEQKDEELAAAIQGFCEQFGIQLAFNESRDFLQHEYRVTDLGASVHGFDFSPSEVEFDCSFQDGVAADVVSDGDDYCILRWTNGRWVGSNDK